MDIVRALRELYAEKKHLDATIAALEARIRSGYSGSAARRSEKRRGRKSMSAEERLEVSKRMRLYWEARRAQIHPSPAPNEDQQARTTSAS